MKNTLLALSIAFTAAFSAQAQDSSTSDFKPVAGDKTAEVGFNLNNGVFLNGGQLKFRKFTSDNKAFRLGTSLHLENDSQFKNTSATFGIISITPGIERHFTGTSRISPYIGTELPLSFAFSSYEDSHKTMTGGWNINAQNRAFIGVGLNTVAGVDIYIIRSLFIGLEFGAGISYKKYSDMKIDYKEHDHSDQTIEGGSSTNFNTFSNGGFRIGFVF